VVDNISGIASGHQRGLTELRFFVAYLTTGLDVASLLTDLTTPD